MKCTIKEKMLKMNVLNNIQPSKFLKGDKGSAPKAFFPIYFKNGDEFLTTWFTKMCLK